MSHWDIDSMQFRILHNRKNRRKLNWKVFLWSPNYPHFHLCIMIFRLFLSPFLFLFGNLHDIPIILNFVRNAFESNVQLHNCHQICGLPMVALRVITDQLDRHHLFLGADRQLYLYSTHQHPSLISYVQIFTSVGRFPFIKLQNFTEFYNYYTDISGFE